MACGRLAAQGVPRRGVRSLAGDPERMSLDDISAELSTQKANEKSPVHWVEIPGSDRVVHVSEVP